MHYNSMLNHTVRYVNYHTSTSVVNCRGMADDERERMDAALTILNMANSGVASPPPGQPRAPHTDTAGQQQPPQNGISNTQPSAQAAPTSSRPEVNSTVHTTAATHTHRQVLLPKVPRNVLLRSRLESKIAARNEAAALTLSQAEHGGAGGDEATPLPVQQRSAVTSPRRKKRRTKPTASQVLQPPAEQRHMAISEQDRQRFVVNDSAGLYRQDNNANSRVTLSSSGSVHESRSIGSAQTGEFTHRPTSSRNDQSIGSESGAYASRVLSASESRTAAATQPKIDTTIYGGGHVSSLQHPRQPQQPQQRQQPHTVAASQLASRGVRMSSQQSASMKSARSGLKLDIASSQREAVRLPVVSYSPISPADGHAAYTVIGTPSLRTLSNVVQSEPLDLSKDTTRTGTVPLMQLVSPGVTDMSKHPLFSGAGIQSEAGSSTKGLPYQFVSFTQQLAVRDGKLVVVASPVTQNSLPGEQSPAVQSPSAVMSNPALLANPGAYGMQLVQDKQAGHALLLPSPQPQAKHTSRENPFIPRHSSYPNSLSSIAEHVERQAQSEIDRYKERVNSRPGSAHSSPNQQLKGKASPSPKETRAQSSLPPKKRKIFEQEADEPQQTTAVTSLSPQSSVAPTRSSLPDEGYHTLKEEIVSSATSPTISPQQHTRDHSQPSVTAVRIGSAYDHFRPTMPSRHFSQLPQPRMSTGLADSAAAAGARLLLSRSSSGTAAQPAGRITAHNIQSLPVNLEHINSSPPNTPQAAGNKDTMQEVLTQKLFDEYTKSIREGGDVRPGKSPFQHFRPARVRRSNSTQVSVDLTSGYNWKSTVTAKIEQDSNNKMLSGGSGDTRVGMEIGEGPVKMELQQNGGLMQKRNFNQGNRTKRN